ncbi:hypothetical protein [Streptomyces sp. VRA16 Mangrove soil]|uniref:hypothetical protein n=1 Tax=Streptomyces sp. VRA16 Mangrove soil TaxID=2817434 RepID=UPI001A9E43FA|nr:hypothetical protein [Streptomyces sp. VRA16 Mangrove soil]MBO1335079.1 hypothetical protein [Streptomyces sp. VRA16 Mangrove soil]
MSVNLRSPRSLRPLERRLVVCAVRGEALDLLDGGEATVATMRGWGPDRRIRADVIRELLRGRHAEPVDPIGVRVRGAVVEGRLNLDSISATHPLGLDHCYLPHGLSARGAAVPGVTLRGCRLEGQDLSPLFAPGLTTDWIDLTDASVKFGGSGTAMFLPAAKVAGSLNLTDVYISSPHARAVFAQGLEVGGDLVLQGRFRAIGADPRALVDLAGARIGIDMSCASATVENKEGPALHARGLHVGGRLLLNGGLSVTGRTDRAALNLSGADIGGWLYLDDARIDNSAGAALWMSHARIGGSVKVGPGARMTGGGSLASVDMDRCRVAGNVQFEQATLTSTGGTCVSLLRASIGASLSFYGEVHLRNAGDDPLVRLGGIAVGGNVSFERSTFEARRSVAISASNAQIGNDFLLGDEVTITCSSRDDAVTLKRSQLGGDLNLQGVRIENRRGGALAAFDLTAVNVRVEGHSIVKASSPRPVVRLYGARIRARLLLGEAELHNDRGPALSCFNAQARDSLRIFEGFRAVGRTDQTDQEDACTIDFGNFRVDGDLVMNLNGVRNVGRDTSRVSLDGMTYSGIPRGLDVHGMLTLIRDGSTVYAAQPYQQLAAVYRAAGHDREVRRILMAQRRDQSAGDLDGVAQRTWLRLSGLLLGYGYQPWRALVWLLCVLMVSVGLALVLGSQGALVHTAQSAAPGTQCSAVEQIGAGLDMGLPLVKTGQAATCRAAADGWGQALVAVGWPLQVTAWAFATLFVAGFTGAVRRNA